MNKRPLSIALISWLYIVAGVIGLGYHLTEIDPRHAFPHDAVWILLIRAIAVVCGVFMLRGSNWARWLALAWIVYHVIISGLHAVSEVAVHSALCAVIAFVLFRPPANLFFRRDKISAT